MISTGHGATLTFGTSLWTGAIVSIDGFETTRETLDVTTLASVNFRQKLAGDLKDVQPFSVTCLWDAEDTAPLPPMNRTAETVTITYPLTNSVANITKAKYVGAAFVTLNGTPELATDQVMQGTFTVQFTGGPTFTPEEDE